MRVDVCARSFKHGTGTTKNAFLTDNVKQLLFFFFPPSGIIFFFFFFQTSLYHDIFGVKADVERKDVSRLQVGVWGRALQKEKIKRLRH